MVDVVVPDSSWSHGLKPARLLCPWDSPGKNTEVGYHFLPQGTFLTQGLNPCLLFSRQILYHWATWEAWEEFWKQHNLGTESTLQAPGRSCTQGRKVDTHMTTEQEILGAFWVIPKRKSVMEVSQNELIESTLLCFVGCSQRITCPTNLNTPGPGSQSTFWWRSRVNAIYRMKTSCSSCSMRRAKEEKGGAGLSVGNRAIAWKGMSSHSSVQFSRSVMPNSFQPQWLQHTRLPCPSPTPGAYSNLCP